MPWGAILSFRLYEVFRYRTVESPLMNLLFIIMNREKWNSLPPDIQQAIMSVSGVQGSAIASANHGFSEGAEALEIMKKAGKVMEEVHLDPGEYEKWQGIAGKPLWDKYVAELEAKGLAGKKVLERLLAIREKYK